MYAAAACAPALTTRVMTARHSPADAGLGVQCIIFCGRGRGASGAGAGGAAAAALGTAALGTAAHASSYSRRGAPCRGSHPLVCSKKKHAMCFVHPKKTGGEKNHACLKDITSAQIF